MEYPHKLSLRILIILLLILIYPEIYSLFLFLTKTISFLILKLIYPSAILQGNSFLIKNTTFNLISACIALPAYYFLYFLILMTKEIKLKILVKLVIVGTLLIMIMNIFRIDFLISLYLEFGKTWFNYIHLFFWKFISLFYVVLVWIYLTRRYNVSSIPGYSDLSYLYSKSIFR